MFFSKKEMESHRKEQKETEQNEKKEPIQEIG